MVTDLQSSNGTILNGKRIKTALLKPGDYLRLGYTVISYQVVGKKQMAPAPSSTSLARDSKA